MFKFPAGQVARCDRVSAVREQADAAADAASKEDRDEAADEGAQDGCSPESDEHGGIRALELSNLVLAARADLGREAAVVGELDERLRFLGESGGKPIGLLKLDLHGEGADEHGQDKDTGADAKLGFELHGLP